MAATLDTLPNELLLDVFGRLTAAELLPLRGVCKRIHAATQQAGKDLLTTHHRRLQRVITPNEMTGMSLLDTIRRYIEMFGRPSKPKIEVVSAYASNIARLYCEAHRLSIPDALWDVERAVAFLLWYSEAYPDGPTTVLWSPAPVRFSGGDSPLWDTFWDALFATRSEDNLRRIVEIDFETTAVTAEEIIAAAQDLRNKPLQGRVVDYKTMLEMSETMLSVIYAQSMTLDGTLRVGGRVMKRKRYSAVPNARLHWDLELPYLKPGLRYVPASMEAMGYLKEYLQRPGDKVLLATVVENLSVVPDDWIEQDA